MLLFQTESLVYWVYTYTHHTFFFTQTNMLFELIPLRCLKNTALTVQNDLMCWCIVNAAKNCCGSFFFFKQDVLLQQSQIKQTSPTISWSVLILAKPTFSVTKWHVIQYIIERKKKKKTRWKCVLHQGADLGFFPNRHVSVPSGLVHQWPLESHHPFNLLDLYWGPNRMTGF